MNLHLVSLGCARNLVDSEIMMGRLEKAGWTLTDDPGTAHVIVVNTCSFIESAVEESIDTILELASLKNRGPCQRLIVAGCLPQRYGDEIGNSLPEVDLFLGTGGLDRIVSAVADSVPAKGCFLPDPSSRRLDPFDAPRKISNSYSAYLKVAEGCSRNCTYCIIPRLRGKYRSRPLADIISEADRLISMGVKELNLVAQDATSWGSDFLSPGHPSHLLDSLSTRQYSKLWIRMLYGHPDRIDDHLIRTMNDTSGVLPYFDIPVQHVSEKILRRMGRRNSPKDLYRFFSKIRELSPEAVLRTTLIVGFPGESEDDVNSLLNFIRKVRFDHLGVFTYSDAPDLPSHRLQSHIKKAAAKKRYERLMSAQAKISAENNLKYLDGEFDVLIEEAPEEGVYLGRTWFQAPEVDGITYVRTQVAENTTEDPEALRKKRLNIGSFVRVRISDTLEYDLVGEPL